MGMLNLMSNLRVPLGYIRWPLFSFVASLHVKVDFL